MKVFEDLLCQPEDFLQKVQEARRHIYETQPHDLVMLLGSELRDESEFMLFKKALENPVALYYETFNLRPGAGMVAEQARIPMTRIAAAQPKQARRPPPPRPSPGGRWTSSMSGNPSDAARWRPGNAQGRSGGEAGARRSGNGDGQSGNGDRHGPEQLRATNSRKTTFGPPQSYLSQVARSATTPRPTDIRQGVRHGDQGAEEAHQMELMELGVDEETYQMMRRAAPLN